MRFWKHLTFVSKIIFILWSAFVLIGCSEDITQLNSELVLDIIIWMVGCFVLVVPIQLITHLILRTLKFFNNDSLSSSNSETEDCVAYSHPDKHKSTFGSYKRIRTPPLPIKCRKMQKIANTRIKSIPKNEIDSIDKYSGDQFEKYIASLMVEKGYTDVQQTPASGDYGVDVVGTKNGVRYGVQCKRYQKTVGVKAVQEVTGGLNYWGCDKGIVVTNNFFTSNASTLANANGVQLIDRFALLMIIQTNNRKITTIRNSVNDQLALYKRWKRERDRHTFRRKVKKCKNKLDWDEIVMGICSALVAPGQYVIGKDIPAGKYDVRAFYGNGHITLFDADENTIKINATLGTINEQLYYAREFKGLDCQDGDILLIELVKVELAKSEPVEFVTHND